MRQRDIDTQIRNILSLTGRTRTACGHDLELMSHWAKYLCVLSAGLIENALPILFSDLTQSAASPFITNFVRQSLGEIQNPKTVRFLGIAKMFKTQWETDLKKYVDSDGRKEAIDTIMKNRHLIAHGKNSDITLAQLQDYLQRAIEVLEFIESDLH